MSIKQGTRIKATRIAQPGSTSINYADILQAYTNRLFRVLVQEKFIPEGLHPYFKRFDAPLFYETTGEDLTETNLPCEKIVKAIEQGVYIRFINPDDIVLVHSLITNVLEFSKQKLSGFEADPLLKDDYNELKLILSDLESVLYKLSEPLENHRQQMIQTGRLPKPVKSLSSFFQTFLSKGNN